MTPVLDAIAATNVFHRLLIVPPGGEDMRRFAALTHGRRCIVGSVTAKDLKLPGRELIAATRDLAHAPGDMVIGGSQVYKSYWPLIRRIFISRFSAPVHKEVCGEPLDLTGFKREMNMGSADHTFEVWTRA